MGILKPPPKLLHMVIFTRWQFLIILLQAKFNIKVKYALSSIEKKQRLYALAVFLVQLCTRTRAGTQAFPCFFCSVEKVPNTFKKVPFKVLTLSICLWMIQTSPDFMDSFRLA